MKPVSNRAIVILIFLSIVGIVAWVWLWNFGDKMVKQEKKDKEATQLLKQQWAKATKDRDLYRLEKELKDDTIMMLSVELGQSRIEVNRMEARLRQANAEYKQSKIAKDTARALTICDSVIYTYLPGYWKADSAAWSISDSLINYTDRVVKRTDSVIELQFGAIDTLYIKRLIDRQKADDKKKESRKAENKKVVKASIFGAAIGVLLTLLFGG